MIVYKSGKSDNIITEESLTNDNVSNRKNKKQKNCITNRKHKKNTIQEERHTVRP